MPSRGHPAGGRGAQQPADLHGRLDGVPAAPGAGPAAGRAARRGRTLPVVARARVEAVDPVGHLAAGGQHQQPHRGSRRSALARHTSTVHRRVHQSSRADVVPQAEQLFVRRPAVVHHGGASSRPRLATARTIAPRGGRRPRRSGSARAQPCHLAARRQRPETGSVVLHEGAHSPRRSRSPGRRPWRPPAAAAAASRSRSVFSDSLNGADPRSVLPAFAARVPAQPPPDPVAQVSSTVVVPSGPGFSDAVATLTADGNVTPVGVLFPLGSKQPSNSCRVVDGRPRVSLIVWYPTS